MSKSTCLASMQVVFANGKEKSPVMLNVGEFSLRAVENGEAAVQENYSAIVCFCSALLTP